MAIIASVRSMKWKMALARTTKITGLTVLGSYTWGKSIDQASSLGVTTTTTATPEPSSIVLLLTSMAGLAMVILRAGFPLTRTG